MAMFMQREFFEILKERNQEGTTVFLSSHVLSSGQVNDLAVTEPDLEEVFLHYYEKDGETA